MLLDKQPFKFLTMFCLSDNFMSIYYCQPTFFFFFQEQWAGKILLEFKCFFFLSKTPCEKNKYLMLLTCGRGEPRRQECKMLILPSKIVCWNSCKKSNELHALVQRSTSPNLWSLQKHCFLHMRFIRSLLKTLLFLYILISLITVIQRCIIISIAIYWKHQEGINVNVTDLTVQDRLAISINSFGRQHCLLFTMLNNCCGC